MPYTVKKIDIHVHTKEDFGYSFPRKSGETYATPEQIRVMYDRMGIEWGVLQSGDSPEGMTRIHTTVMPSVPPTRIPKPSSGSWTLTRA